MLLFVGDVEDLTGAYLVWLARERGIRVVDLEEMRLGVEWAFELDEHRLEGGVTIWTASDKEECARVPLDAVTGVIVRLNPKPGLPFTGDEDMGVVSAVLVPERRAAIQNLVDSLDLKVANRTSSGRDNACKPAHMRRLEAAGFDVPAWLLTNCVSAAQSFVDLCRCGAVLKAASGLRSHVRLWDQTTAASFASGTVPHVVQQYIPGYDVRVHVVGDKVFATQVLSKSTDYRFDTGPTSFEALYPPGHISRMCTEFARNERLLLAGFDFRVEKGRRWWCLESNPVPTFLPYEAATGQRIGDAVIDLLAPETSPSYSFSPLARAAGVPRPENSAT